eukprot:SM000290S10890  [mRNA]  locus=s290:82631:89400:+ [translate_table: standard]
MALLEAAGVRPSEAARVARACDGQTVAALAAKIGWLEAIVADMRPLDEGVAGVLRRSLRTLSAQPCDALQLTIAFVQKLQAQQGGLETLDGAAVSAVTSRLLEGFPSVLRRSLDADLLPLTQHLTEDWGLPPDQLGRVVLAFPPILLSTVAELVLRKRALKEVGVRVRDLGKMVMRYPWILSGSAHHNLPIVVDYLKQIQVPARLLDRAITACPQLLGSSPARQFAPAVSFLEALGATGRDLGLLVGRCPRLLLRTPMELHSVAAFLEEHGLDTEGARHVLLRSPEVFASSVEGSLRIKVAFLRELGVHDQRLAHVLRRCPEVLAMSVDHAMRPRLQFLIQQGISAADVARMVQRYPPLLGYNVDTVLAPKLHFLIHDLRRPVGDIVAYPKVFSYDLEKKIKRRARVAARLGRQDSLRGIFERSDRDFAAEYLGLTHMLVPPPSLPPAHVSSLAEPGRGQKVLWPKRDSGSSAAPPVACLSSMGCTRGVSLAAAAWVSWPRCLDLPFSATRSRQASAARQTTSTEGSDHCGGSDLPGVVVELKGHHKVKNLRQGRVLPPFTEGSPPFLLPTFGLLHAEELRPPLAVDELGNLFNKEALVAALVAKELPPRLRHIRGLRDILTVHLTENPAAGGARWHCPVTGLECNGRFRFVALRPCGHVLSARALREAGASAAAECLVCHNPHAGEAEAVPINPTEEEAAALRAGMEARAAARREERKRLSCAAAAASRSADSLTVEASPAAGRAAAIAAVSGHAEAASHTAAATAPAKRKAEAGAPAAEVERPKGSHRVAPPVVKRPRGPATAVPKHATSAVYRSIFVSRAAVAEAAAKETFMCRNLPIGRIRTMENTGTANVHTSKEHDKWHAY